MLSQITVENAALIKKAQIEFDGGFCAVTGETGAGKTVFVTALGLLCGEKASAKLVKEGESECRVNAVFTDISPVCRELISLAGLGEADDDCVTVSRTVKADGKSVCRINTHTVPQSVMKNIGARLLQMHSQHQTYQLTDRATHLDFVDGLCEGGKKREYEAAFEEYSQAKSLLEATKALVKDGAMKKDILRAQIKEISSAALKDNEEDRLWERHRMLENHGKISAAASFTRQAISGTEKQKGAIDRVMLASARLAALREVVPEFGELSDKLESLGYELEAIMQNVDELSPDSGESPERLMDKISDRISLIRRLKKKYGATEQEIKEYLERIKQELETIDSGGESIERLSKKADAALENCLNKGKELDGERRSAARKLEEAVNQKLKFLDMEKASFIVEFTEPGMPAKRGISDCGFMLRANPGQAPGELDRIASGGELSRIMLALKSVSADDSRTQTLIFDEIDTGISGKTARKIGMLLEEISAHTQIIAVTHSAQIASLAHEHYKLKKQSSANSTESTVIKLEGEDRVEELARILGGIKITDTVRENAKELLLKK